MITTKNQNDVIARVNPAILRLDSRDYKDTLETVLTDMLPHGSGINGDWKISINSDPVYFSMSNFYEAMTEFGFYCHVYDFSLRFKLDRKTGYILYLGFNFHSQKEYSCCGYGIKDYLQDSILDSLFYEFNTSGHWRHYLYLTTTDTGVCQYHVQSILADTGIQPTDLEIKDSPHVCRMLSEFNSYIADHSILKDVTEIADYINGIPEKPTANN